MPTFWECKGAATPWGAGPLSHSDTSKNGRL